MGAGASAARIAAPSLSPTIAPAAVPTLPPFSTTQAFSPGVPNFGMNTNVSRGVGNGSFGTGITPTVPAPPALPPSPFEFSRADVGRSLGARPQSFSSLTPLTPAMLPTPAASPSVSPFDFSRADVSGFDAALPTLPPATFGSADVSQGLGPVGNGNVGAPGYIQTGPATLSGTYGQGVTGKGDPNYTANMSNLFRLSQELNRINRTPFDANFAADRAMNQSWVAQSMAPPAPMPGPNLSGLFTRGTSPGSAPAPLFRK